MVNYTDMDLLFPDFFPIAIALLCISLSVFFLFYKRKSSKIKLPPGKAGWPIIGETWDFVMASRRGNPEKFMNDRMNKYSPDVFQTSLLRDHMAVFCGPSGNKMLFSSEDKYVNMWYTRPFKEILRDGSTDSWKEETLKSFTLLPEFLKPEAIKRYVPIMDSVVREHFEMDLFPHKQVTVQPSTKKYTFSLSCRIFLSIKDPEIVARLEKLLTRMTDGLMALPVNIPGTTYNRAVKGGKMIRNEIQAIIKQRKRELMSQNNEPEAIDLLTRLLLASEESGKTVTDDDIAKNIAMNLNVILVASHDTTSTVITMVMYYLADHPHVYEKVLKEQMEIAKSKSPGELLNWNDMQKMKYSWCVVCETMRVATPVIGGCREAISDFSYAGFTIPKGWKVFWSPFSTHKNPKYFPNPENFDPSRFEGATPAPYTFVPFGAGPRMCPGREYARLEILVFLHNMVTKYKWKKVLPNEKIVYTSFPKPENGLPIHLYAHKNELVPLLL